MDLAFSLATLVTLMGCGICVVLLGSSLVSVQILPRLKDHPDTLESKEPWPKVSIIVPACNEGRTIETAMNSLLQLDYPALEVILVNDRSSDNTGAIMDRIAAQDPRFKAHHLSELPEGWLGKVHAMNHGTSLATGSFLLFTDADAQMERSCLKRAVARMESEQLGHLTAMPSVEKHGFLYNASLASFTIAMFAGIRAWRFRKPDSGVYAGVGQFSLVRKSDFDRTPGWEWLRMEIADDVGLGMLLVRKAGSRSNFVVGTDSIHFDWYDGLGGLVKGLEKNFYSATSHYSPARALLVVAAFICAGLGPWVAIFGPLLFWEVMPSWLLGTGVCLWAIQVLVAVAFRKVQLPFWSTLFSTAGFLVMAWTLVYSATRTIRQGGVYWRDSFYPVERLKKEGRVKL